MSQRSAITVQVPGQWRGPDLCTPDVPAQVAWLDSAAVKPFLTARWHCTWETDEAGFQGFLDLLADHLIAPDQAVYDRLVEVRQRATVDLESHRAQAAALVAEHPQVAELHFLHGQVLEWMRDLDAAREAYDRCVALAPAHGEAWMRTGFLRRTDPDAQDACLACHQRAVALLPRSTSAGYLLARQLARMDRLEEAQAEMARTIDLDPGTPPDSFMHRARWLHALGRTPEALATLDACALQSKALVALRAEIEGA